MKLVRGICLATTLGMALLLGQSGAAQEKEKEQGQTVAKILKVDIKVLDSKPPQLVVSAVGQVNTGGYTNTKLVRAMHKTPPKDGIQDYFLKSVPPDGIATQVISEVTASDTWKTYEKDAPWLKGVRVNGVDGGAMVKMIAGK